MIKEYENGVFVDLKTGSSEEGKKGRGRRRHFSGEENPKYEMTNNIKGNAFFKQIPVESQDYSSIKGPRYYAHGMVEVVHNAFNRHNPVEFSPDDIWLMICQAISQHEEMTGILGKLYKLPNPKQEIEIRADDFVKGNPDNDWPRVFGQFEEGIKKNVPETLYNLISNKKYSTTTQLNQICSTICLMDSLKRYFDYSVCTLCRIPQVYLKGKKEDWESVLKNTMMLSQSGFGLKKWFEVVLGIIQKFIDVFDKKEVDKTFWSSIYKYNDGSGGPSISGWILAFFPYTINRRNGKLEKVRWLDRLRQNPEKQWLKVLAGASWHGIMGPSGIPNGVNTVPFTWKYLGSNFKYNFYGGFMGLKQDKNTGCLSARCGWAVAEDTWDK